jgi:hypothetical protein
VPSRHPTQKLMQSTRQRSLIPIASMLRYESIDF